MSNKVINELLEDEYIENVVSVLEELREKIGVIAQSWNGDEASKDEDDFNYANDTDVEIALLIDRLRGEYEEKDYQL